MKRRLFFGIWLLALLGAVAIIPYLLSTQAELLQSADLPFSLPILLLIGLLQNGVLLAVMTAIGLALAARVGLRLPLFEAWLQGEPLEKQWRKRASQAAMIGILAALIIVGLELLYFKPAMAGQGLAFPDSAQPPAWQGFLAAFYGGITEEVMLRLFLMTLLVWLGSKLQRSATGQPTAAIHWLAIILAAIFFGLGHLPATAGLGVPLTGLVIARALVLNGIPGLCFGWLYWQRGLAYAMIAHFAADILLHVIVPLVPGAP